MTRISMVIESTSGLEKASEELAHPSLPTLVRHGHAAHCMRCITGLPESQVEVDASRSALVFYCLGSFDLLGSLPPEVDGRIPSKRESWREWIWRQQTTGYYGTGFKPSSYMTLGDPLEFPEGVVHWQEDRHAEFDMPHMIMTYTALLSLAILRDDFARLDRAGIIQFLKFCQREDGSFSTMPGEGDTDLRTLYCAFAISWLLDDWSGVNVDRALEFIATCRTYEGGYGQYPFCEAQGGTTYIAVASLQLATTAAAAGVTEHLTESERQQTVRWLVHNQDASGGFRGRTGKEADACYCFWCGAALQILGAGDLVNRTALAAFLARCQFKYGGIAKAPGENPDPFHTYLSLAAIAMYSPSRSEEGEDLNPSWKFEPFNAVLNSREETVRWAMQHIPARKDGKAVTTS